MLPNECEEPLPLTRKVAVAHLETFKRLRGERVLDDRGDRVPKRLDGVVRLVVQTRATLYFIGEGELGLDGLFRDALGRIVRVQGVGEGLGGPRAQHGDVQAVGRL